MPTSTRKSSLGRRGPQKAHIPYRGDNPEVGKKTGIAVQHVERKSDGFEPFDELIQAADGLTPPQRKARRKSLAAQRQQEDDDDDEDGEQSMQIDSPVRHLVNLRPPISPPTIRRRSSIRPVARTSEMDFDQIPSPRLTSLHKSLLNGGGPGPSSLSKSRTYREAESSASTNEDREHDYGGGGNEDHTMPDYEENHSTRSNMDRRTTSFSQIDQDDDEEEEEEEEDHEPTPKPIRQQKGKGKAVPRKEQDEEMENGIAQGLEDVELEPESDASQEVPVKRSKSSTETGDRTRSRSKKENRVYREGSRRSQRKPMKPLAFWRGERYVYGKPEDYSGRVLVPPIREVIRIPVEPTMPLGGKRKRGTSRARSKSKVEPDEDQIPPPLPVENPEEGWDDATEAKCLVLRFESQVEVERRIAWTANMVKPKKSRNAWSFDKIFNDDSFIAAGQLVIPPNGLKPSKQAKDNTYVFYVIEGAVNFKIHNTSMVLATGGMFMVPRGNTYFIENICNRDARLFFTQARKLDLDEEEKGAKEMHDEAAERRRLSGRSSSVGVTPSKKIHTPKARAASLPST